MAKRRDEEPRKRFSKSGHTTHRSPVVPPAPPPAPYQPPPRTRELPTYQPPADGPRYRPPAYPEPPRREPRYQEPRYQEPRYQDPDYEDIRYDDPRYRAPSPDDQPTRGYQPPPPRTPPSGYPDQYGDPYAGRTGPPVDPYGPPSYHAPGPDQPTTAAGPQTVGGAALSLGKATISGTNRAARTVTRKVITASKSDGAEESGLTALIWNQVLSYGTDAMITVSLAGTVFFGASAHAQRGNVLLYLLVTMAPFAVVAPIIGPILDRFQHGRRWTMAATGIGRAILALVMAGHSTELLVLYPCALGSLVLSKAYGVVRAAAAPRLVPPGMTLTAANAKLTIFGLGSTLVLGGLVGVIIKVTGSYSLGLIVTAIGFAACAFFAFSLPKQVDSSAAAARHPGEPVRPRRQDKVAPLSRIQGWARKGFDPHLVIALQGESVLRLLSGMLTIYLAFYVESTQHGLQGVVELGGVVGAAGAGNFIGTAIGTRLKMAKPEVIIIISTVIAAVALVIAALTFSVLVGIIAMLVCATTNALSKIALDSLIQNDVVETLRSSAFARSETFLQLAWVIGAALGVVLPSNDTSDGTVAFIVAAVITAAVAILVTLRNRAMNRLTGPPDWHGQHGSAGSVPYSVD